MCCGSLQPHIVSLCRTHFQCWMSSFDFTDFSHVFDNHSKSMTIFSSWHPNMLTFALDCRFYQCWALLGPHTLHRYQIIKMHWCVNVANSFQLFYRHCHQIVTYKNGRSLKQQWLLRHSHYYTRCSHNHLNHKRSKKNEKRNYCQNYIPFNETNLSFFLHFISRFINARRRIVQPMIDQSNRAGKC